MRDRIQRLSQKRQKGIRKHKSYLGHVKKFLEVAYEKKVYVNFFKGVKEPVNEHESYKEADILELIKVLRDYSDAKF